MACKITHTLNSTHAVVHVRASDQVALCKMFVRLQEFYESPYNDIRGHHFTLDYFKTRYALDHGGKFSYFTDWHGFNVPGNVVRDFFSTFADRTEDEWTLFDATRGFEKVYLIGSHDDSGPDEDALNHELAHATYYLDDAYRVEADVLVREFHATLECYKLERWLKKQGYSDATLDDEFNAYLATTDELWWADSLGDKALAYKLWTKGKRFRDLYAEYRCATRWL